MRINHPLKDGKNSDDDNYCDSYYIEQQKNEIRSENYFRNLLNLT